MEGERVFDGKGRRFDGKGRKKGGKKKGEKASMEGKKAKHVRGTLLSSNALPEFPVVCHLAGPAQAAKSSHQ